LVQVIKPFAILLLLRIFMLQSAMPRISLLLSLAVVAAPHVGAAAVCAKAGVQDDEPDAMGLLQMPERAAKAADAQEVLLDGSWPHMPHLGWNGDDSETMSNRGEYFREHTGIHTNGAGDLAAFLTAVSVNLVVVAVMAVAFSFLRRQFPDVYCSNTLGDNPRTILNEEEKTGLFGWCKAAMRILHSTDLVEATVGLDQCMLLEYTSFAMKLMLVVGIPHVLVLAPLHFWFGGGAADGDAEGASDYDRLSSIGFANVEVGSPLCWVHGFVVWFVVAATQWLVFEAQGKFMKRRVAWLKRMPFPRCNTILVENIDSSHCSDEKLKAYFNQVFDEDVVDEAYVVRDTTKVLALVSKLDEHRGLLQEAQATQSPGDGAGEPASRPKHRVLTDIEFLGQEVDSIDFYAGKVATLETELAAERARIHDVVKEGGLDEALFYNNGFVTFKKRVNCEHALKHNFSGDMDTFVVSTPPDAGDIRFPALQIDHQIEGGRHVLGYACVAGIFFSFLPLVVAISSVTTVSHLRHLAFFDNIVVHHPGVAAIWDGVVGSFLLTLLMAFVPTFLVITFENFFSLKAEAWKQHKIQQWYFYFLVLFVVLVTGIGSSLSSLVRDLFSQPRSVFWRIADTIPLTTHFYLNFFPAQWAAHVGFLTRNAPLGKYLAFKPLLGAARAKELAEPEDQDYYGIGSRSATFSLLLVTGIVFCTLSPLICVLCFIFFALARLVYSALILTAETSKPDLGGVFWVTQLKHTQQGLIIYITLMCGVLLHRAETAGPGMMALASFALFIPSYLRFDRAFLWESLPFASVIATSVTEGAELVPTKLVQSDGMATSRYEQLELRNDPIKS